MHTVTEPKQIEAGARTSRDRYGFLGRGEERHTGTALVTKANVAKFANPTKPSSSS